MFFNKTEKGRETRSKILKPVIDIREHFEKEFKDIPNFIEDNRDLVEEITRAIPIEYTWGNEYEQWDGSIPIRYEEMADFTGGSIVSSAVSSQKKKEKYKLLSKEEILDIRKAFFEVLLFVIKNITVFSAYLWQMIDNIRRSQNYGGVNFDTKYTDQQLFYMAISIPTTIQNAKDLLSIFPLMNSKHRYRLLEIRRNRLATFNKIFKKR